MIASLIAQFGPAVMQFIQGHKQSKMASEMAKDIHDPIYQIPQAAQEGLANARVNAESRYMPGQTNLQNQLDQGTANSTSDVLRTSRSPQDALGALVSINANNQAGQQQIGFQSANNYNQRQGDLRGALQMMSGYQDKKWTNDVLNKFLRDSAATSALRNAGMNNQYQGVKGAANAIGSMGMGGFGGGPKSTSFSTGYEPQQQIMPQMQTADTASGGGFQSYVDMFQNAGQQSVPPGLLNFLSSGGNTSYQ